MGDPEKIKEIIKESYGKIAKSSSSCGCGSCGCNSNQTIQKQSGEMGYSQDEINQAPPDSNLGLGCGNPVAIASLKEDEELLVGCVSGAILKEDYLKLLGEAGFADITMYKETTAFLPDYGLSITFSAVK